MPLPLNPPTASNVLHTTLIFTILFHLVPATCVTFNFLEKFLFTYLAYR
jgi:hypothetical protein